MSARIEFCCPHGFLRSVVRCPHGCSLLPGQSLTTDGTPRRRPGTRKRERAKAPPSPRPRWSDVGDERIIAELRASESAAEAARQLGASQTNLYMYARRRPAVWAAYEVARDKGLRLRGPRGRLCGFKT
jgi:hypothetical protein